MMFLFQAQETVTLRVLDDNDNPPVFINDPYTTSVNEVCPPTQHAMNSKLFLNISICPNFYEKN